MCFLLKLRTIFYFEWLQITQYTLVSGLECLCSILKCMVEWSRDYFINPATTGLNAVYQQSSEDSEEVSSVPAAEMRTGRAHSASRGQSAELSLVQAGEMKMTRASSMSGRYQLSESSNEI